MTELLKSNKSVKYKIKNPFSKTRKTASVSYTETIPVNACPQNTQIDSIENNKNNQTLVLVKQKNKSNQIGVSCCETNPNNDFYLINHIEEHYDRIDKMNTNNKINNLWQSNYSMSLMSGKNNQSTPIKSQLKIERNYPNFSRSNSTNTLIKKGKNWNLTNVVDSKSQISIKINPADNDETQEGNKEETQECIARNDEDGIVRLEEMTRLFKGKKRKWEIDQRRGNDDNISVYGNVNDCHDEDKNGKEGKLKDNITNVSGVVNYEGENSRTGRAKVKNGRNDKNNKYNNNKAHHQWMKDENYDDIKGTPEHSWTNNNQNPKEIESEKEVKMWRTVFKRDMKTCDDRYDSLWNAMNVSDVTTKSYNNNTKECTRNTLNKPDSLANLTSVNNNNMRKHTPGLEKETQDNISFSQDREFVSTNAPRYQSPPPHNATNSNNNNSFIDSNHTSIAKKNYSLINMDYGHVPITKPNNRKYRLLSNLNDITDEPSLSKHSKTQLKSPHNQTAQNHTSSYVDYEASLSWASLNIYPSNKKTSNLNSELSTLNQVGWKTIIQLQKQNHKGGNKHEDAWKPLVSPSCKTGVKTVETSETELSKYKSLSRSNVNIGSNRHFINVTALKRMKKDIWNKSLSSNEGESRHGNIGGSTDYGDYHYIMHNLRSRNETSVIYPVNYVDTVKQHKLKKIVNKLCFHKIMKVKVNK